MPGTRLLAVTCALALAVSCGGATTTSGAATAAAATPAATPAPAATPPIAAPGASANSSQPKLLDLLSAGKLTVYKITYKMTVTGPSAAGMSGEQSWYFKPPKSRFDFTNSIGGQATMISFFSLPDGSYYCVAGGPYAPATCLRLSAAGVGSPLDQNQAAQMQQSLIGHPDQYGATFTSSKTYAGVAALCYDVKGIAAAVSLSTGTFCYSKEGIALYSQFSAQGASWAMEATSVSTTVPDSDFDLPAKPVTP